MPYNEAIAKLPGPLAKLRALSEGSGPGSPTKAPGAGLALPPTRRDERPLSPWTKGR